MKVRKANEQIKQITFHLRKFDRTPKTRQCHRDRGKLADRVPGFGRQKMRFPFAPRPLLQREFAAVPFGLVHR